MLLSVEILLLNNIFTILCYKSIINYLKNHLKLKLVYSIQNNIPLEIFMYTSHLTSNQEIS